MATDLDISWMPTDASFSVERRDVAADPPPDGEFDLVHARLVLTHVPQRDEALRRMASALRPGGWLVVEDFDVSVQPRACPDAATPEEDRANRLREGFIELLVQRGVDLTFGRTLRRRLLGLGLADVGAEAYAPLAVPATRRLEIANTLQVRPALEALGLGDDVAAHLDALAAGRIDVATPPLVTAWGRQPLSRPGTTNAPAIGGGALSWGERNRTPNYRTRICCVASYTTPHGAVRECSGQMCWNPMSRPSATPAASRSSRPSAPRPCTTLDGVGDTCAVRPTCSAISLLRSAW